MIVAAGADFGTIPGIITLCAQDKLSANDLALYANLGIVLTLLPHIKTE